MKDKILNWFKKLVENTPQLIGNKYIKYIAFYLILVYLGFTVMFVYGWIHNLNVTNEADLPIIISFLTFFVSGSTVYAITFLAKLFIDKNNNNQFDELKSIFEKSLAINKNLPENHIITFDDLESKKPKGYGISATDFQKVIGKKLNKEKLKWDFLTEEDIE